MGHLKRICGTTALLATLLVGGCADIQSLIGGDKEAAGTAGNLATGGGLYKVGEPYQVEGVWYYPKVDYTYDETGIASWYGEEFHGRLTANGEIFDANGLTAAHPTLPMPSYVRVTNLENGRAIRLRVNDRGPFKRGRIIDLSRRAAQLLGFYEKGTAKVRVEILEEDSRMAARLAGQSDIPEGERIRTAAAGRGTVTAEVLAPPDGIAVASNTPDTLTDAVSASVATGASRPARGTEGAAADRAPAGMIGSMGLGADEALVTVTAVKPTSIYVQAGSFTRLDNAIRLRARLAPLGPVTVSQVSVRSQPFFRVRIGPVATVEEADRLLATIVDAGHPEARIVVD